MSTGSETLSPRPAEPASIRAGVSRAVADDLEAIFPNPAPSTAQGPQKLRLGRRTAEATSRSFGERRAAVWGAVIAAACIGVSAGALIARDGRSAASPPVEVSAKQPAPVLAGVAATPAPAAAPLPSPGPLAPSPVARVNLPEPVQADTAPKPSAPKVRKAAVKKVEAKRKPKAVTRSVCGGYCDHGDVMAADRRLRRAYSAAVRAGVSRSVLVSYRNRWAGLRHRAPRQPELVVARYNAMAGDLNRLAGRRRLAEHGSSRSSALW